LICASNDGILRLDEYRRLEMKEAAAMELFDEVPYIENARIVLRPIEMSDAEALEKLANSDAVYRFLPTFLYEQKYADKRYAIENMQKECVDTKESILLAVCLKDGSEMTPRSPEAKRFRRSRR